MKISKQTNTRYGNMLFFEGDNTIGLALDLYGEYCYTEVEWMTMLTNPKSFVLDIGANIGTHTIPISKHVDRVMAFEPDPDNFDLLVKNLAMTMCKNVTTAPVAIADTTTQVGTLFDYGKTTLTGAGNIPCTSIDEIQDLPKVDFVKIDVEGMELQVLQGMRNTIAKDKPQMLIEMQDATTYPETFDFLQQQGYRIYWLPVATYYKDNHKGNSENVFGTQHGVINWIATIANLDEQLIAVVDRDDTVERMNYRQARYQQ